MKLKLDEAGHAVLADGKPIYIHDDGKEVAFDAAGATQSYRRAVEESKGYKSRAQAAEEALKAFEGIENADDARRALETVRNLDQGHLVAANKVDEIKSAAEKAAEERVKAAIDASTRKLKELEAERDRVRTELYQEKVGGSFARSKFISERVAAPVDMLQATFGARFKIEDGKVVGHDASGNKIWARANPGQEADFEEAIESMIESYPNRDRILKGTGSTGSGALPVNGARGGPDLSGLSPAARITAARSAARAR